jgi:hypothetical protein
MRSADSCTTGTADRSRGETFLRLSSTPPEMTDAKRLSVADAPISRVAARHALKRVAADARTLTIGRYAAQRRTQLEQAYRRDAREGRELATCLPTASQIYWAYDRDWDAALIDAGLEPGAGRGRQPGATSEGVGPCDAYILFTIDSAHQREPETMLELREWFSGRFSVAGRTGLSWDDWRRLSKERLNELDLDPAKLDASKVAAYLEELGPLPDPRKHRYHRLEVIASARRFREFLRGRSPHDNDWRAFAASSDGEPDLKVIKRHGGFRAVLAEAARPDWEPRAIRWEEERVRARERAKPKKPKPTKPNRRPGPSERVLVVLDLIRECGSLQSHVLAEEFDVTRVRASQIFAELFEYGLVRRTHPISQTSPPGVHAHA